MITFSHIGFKESYFLAGAHIDVFGETIDDRRKRKASLKEAIARGDDNFINIPAYERSKG